MLRTPSPGHKRYRRERCKKKREKVGRLRCRQRRRSSCLEKMSRVASQSESRWAGSFSKSCHIGIYAKMGLIFPFVMFDNGIDQLTTQNTVFASFIAQVLPVENYWFLKFSCRNLMIFFNFPEENSWFSQFSCRIFLVFFQFSLRKFVIFSIFL